MVPTQLMKLESIPLTTSGKLNRKALPEPNWGEAGRGDYEPPQGELEEQLTKIWQEVLGVERVGRNDSFFALGGNSLKAIKMVSVAQETFQMEINLAEIFQSATVADFSNRILELYLK
jgi:acyl carrier protein